MSSYILLGYVLVFGLSAVACFLSLRRVSEIQDPDIRIGLISLLVTSGSWAATHVGYLLAPSELLKLSFYVIGLIVGFATIGAWLYFCSAYSGRTYHRQRLYRRLALGGYIAVVLLKLTNPIHSLYYTTEIVSSPFHHLAVTHGLLHWVAMALAYGLAFVGFFMLFERFVSVGLDTRPLTVLVGVTALPIVFDVLGLASPALVDMTYEPIGVALFAVGVFFVYFERFQAVHLAGGADVPVIFLDREYRVRDYNRRAQEQFPALHGSIGRPISEVSEDLAEGTITEGHIVTDLSGENERYSVVSVTPFTAGDTNTGYLLTLSDVTEAEQYRRELEEKTETLEQFASVVSHDLRNPLNVAQLRLDLVRDECDSEHLDDVERSLSRMETLIDDLLTLAREGEAIDELQQTNLADVADRCWEGVDTADAELVVETDLTVMADPERLQQLFENLFRNAIEHGGSNVTITVGTLEDGFSIADDGPGIPEEERKQVFEFGYSTRESGTGFGLAIVQQVVDGHDWAISVTESDDGGAKFEVTGVEIVG
ncbi:sensor histidine kinase [Halovenus marina]|uniref:sensor histidine kinase n=1 Tax=Halovenus marina TaxID=3396621 RepID=UPI003F55DFD0